MAGDCPAKNADSSLRVPVTRRDIYRPLDENGKPLPLQPFEIQCQKRGVKEWWELVQPTL